MGLENALWVDPREFPDLPTAQKARNPAARARDGHDFYDVGLTV